MRPQPLICVKDVEASSRWYQRLLHCESAHGGPNYERLVHSGELVLQLHRWEEEHHHGRIGDPNDLPPGNGLLLWFEVDDFDAATAPSHGAYGHQQLQLIAFVLNSKQSGPRRATPRRGMQMFAAERRPRPSTLKISMNRY